ncbi:MAG TPA: DCC1-like thiol-disulfide oxidoreductase family protein [Frankiaceae bacterium]|nr:DCC1-like thiol-disulfide oxidoreductase family protein [Frankiaceae bacterium]
MRHLTVLYDVTCPLCVKAAGWLNDQPKYVPVYFCAAGSPAAREAFPGIDHEKTRYELTVVGDGGEVYYEERGWLMCLWATRRYRGMALRFGTPGGVASAKRFVLWVSRHRRTLGNLVA